jgi:hypothetical protein
MFYPGHRTLKSLKFLFMGPLILVMLCVINLMTSPGEWWVQWAALGIGIVWVISLIRVMSAVVVAGGLAALGLYLFNRGSAASAGGGATQGAGPSGPTRSSAQRPPDIPTVPLARE